jgi:hypothetical protein
MMTPLNITSMNQGKLHKDYEALCDDALAQRETIVRLVQPIGQIVEQLGAALADMKKLLNTIHAKLHTPHFVLTKLGPLRRP